MEGLQYSIFQMRLLLPQFFRLKAANKGSSTANTFLVTRTYISLLCVGGENCCPFFQSQFLTDAFPRCQHAEDYPLSVIFVWKGYPVEILLMNSRTHAWKYYY